MLFFALELKQEVSSSGYVWTTHDAIAFHWSGLLFVHGPVPHCHVVRTMAQTRWTTRLGPNDNPGRENIRRPEAGKSRRGTVTVSVALRSLTATLWEANFRKRRFIWSVAEEGSPSSSATGGAVSEAPFPCQDTALNVCGLHRALF